MKVEKTDASVSGYIHTYDVSDKGIWTYKLKFHNQVQWTWGQIACKLFGEGRYSQIVSCSAGRYSTVILYAL